ncbi:hypothetical protein ACVMIH_007571 [Bradyrhizobium sp. USDA 4503]
MGLVRFTLAPVALLVHSSYGARSMGALASVEAFCVLSGIYMVAVYYTKYLTALRPLADVSCVAGATVSTYLAQGRPRGNDLGLFNLF